MGDISMAKNTKIYITLSLVLIVYVFGVCFGLEIGIPAVIKKNTGKLIEKARIEREARFDVDEGEWSVINEKLVIVGTGNGEYLMWPSKQTCGATNNNDTIKWATGSFPPPIWDNETKSYEYGSYKYDYPAFVWAENLEYEGYSDWRLPTIDELKYLYNYGQDYVSCNKHYVSSTQKDFGNVYYLSFETGDKKGYTKNYAFLVRAVRSSN